MTAGQIRIPHARLIAAGGALAGCAAIFFLARSSTFYFDEWTFILTAPDWTLATYFQPHNEHPSILFRALYGLLLHSVGLRSYLPYLSVLLAAHFVNILLLFELVRRRNGDLIGMSAAALYVLLGAAWDDLLWAFQMAWVLSVAFGLCMLLALQGPTSPRRVGAAMACLSLSLSFSGIGLPFGVAAAVRLAVDRRTRRDLLWLVPVGVALAIWYLAFGRFGSHPNPQPTAANLLIDPAYAVWGLAQSAAAVIGLSGPIGFLILAAAVGAIGWSWFRSGTDAYAIGLTAGLLSFYLVTGLSRAQLGIEQSGSARYAYVAVAFWLLLLGDTARHLPWRGTWRPVLVACVFLAVFNSAVLLFTYAVAYRVVMERQVADYYALAAQRRDPCLDPNGAVDLLVMPPETRPAAFYRAVDAYGDPRAGHPLLDRASYESGLMHLKNPGC